MHRAIRLTKDHTSNMRPMRRRGAILAYTACDQSFYLAEMGALKTRVCNINWAIQYSNTDIGIAKRLRPQYLNFVN